MYLLLVRSKYNDQWRVVKHCVVVLQRTYMCSTIRILTLIHIHYLPLYFRSDLLKVHSLNLGKDFLHTVCTVPWCVKSTLVILFSKLSRPSLRGYHNTPHFSGEMASLKDDCLDTEPWQLCIHTYTLACQDTVELLNFYWTLESWQRTPENEWEGVELW